MWFSCTLVALHTGPRDSRPCSCVDRHFSSGSPGAFSSSAFPHSIRTFTFTGVLLTSFEDLRGRIPFASIMNTNPAEERQAPGTGALGGLEKISDCYLIVPIVLRYFRPWYFVVGVCVFFFFASRILGNVDAFHPIGEKKPTSKKKGSVR